MTADPAVITELPEGYPGQRVPLHTFLDLRWISPPTGSTSAEISLPVAPNALGVTGSLHGGVIATLVDVTCALVAARATGFTPTTESLVTADLHLRYLGSPRTDVVRATATIVKIGSTLIVVDCRVTDTEGHVIATADVSYMRVAHRGTAPG